MKNDNKINRASFESYIILLYPKNGFNKYEYDLLYKLIWEYKLFYDLSLDGLCEWINDFKCRKFKNSIEIDIDKILKQDQGEVENKLY